MTDVPWGVLLSGASTYLTSTVTSIQWSGIGSDGHLNGSLLLNW